MSAAPRVNDDARALETALETLLAPGIGSIAGEDASNHARATS